MPVAMTDKEPNIKKNPPKATAALLEDQSDDELQYSDDDGDIIEGIRIPPAVPPTCSFDPTGPRLIITKIVNNFFKSYAEEQTLGPFQKCFNAIVGPNGSGKSNVIDSMLFVFGYRATKIRSKKISVLLHNSDKYRHVQSCSVAVHFALIIDKEGDNYDIVPDSEFIVSRTANKDNSSYYTLNGRRVQFKEVAKLLKSHGIDLDHNRFLILQGEVEQIAMMKCKGENEHESGMLEYLEDIIGTSRYKKPLVQVHERVEYLTELRTEKINRVQLVNREMDELRAPMEEAVGFLKTENKVSSNKNFLYQKNIYNIEKKLEGLEDEKQEAVNVQKEYENKLKKLNEVKAEKEAELKKQSATYEHLTKRQETLKDAYNKASKKVNLIQETMKQTNIKRKKTKELLAEERKKLEKLHKIPDENKKGIEECESKIEELSAKKEKDEEQKLQMLSNLGKETKALQEKKDVLEDELVGFKKSADETKSALTLAESELKMYVNNEEKEMEKLASLTEEHQSAQATFAERTKQVAQLKKTIPATEKSLNSALRDLNDVRNEENSLISEIRKHTGDLEEKRSSLQATKSRGKVLDSLMAQKRSGACPGFYGRLGDLGAINKKYDVAISTACGPLDNIVVDTVDTAQWCIEYLKKYDLGRATFIALDKQEYLRDRANSRIKTPENVPRLYDLIEIQDEDVRLAFYYAIRDTLVANDLDQATRIAYGANRFRVVSLNGDLIETTGTMSGGGRQVSRGRMGQTVAVSNINPHEITKIEKNIEEMEQQVRECRKRQASLESQVNTLQPQLRQMKYDYEKFSAELKELQQQIPVLEKQLKEQERISKSTKADPVQVKKLKAIIEEKQKIYDAAAEKAAVIQRQVDKITAEIKQKTSGKIKSIDDKIKASTDIIDKCKSEITRLTVGISTSKRNVKKAEEKIASMEQEITDMENKMREMNKEESTVVEDTKKLLTCVEEIAEQRVNEQQLFGGTKNEVASLNKKEHKLRSEKVDVDQKVKSVLSKINDCKGAIHQLEVKISHLKLQEIPGESLEELKKYTHEELEREDVGQIEKELEKAESHLKVAKPNLNAVEEYRKKEAVFIERTKQVEEINARRIQMKNIYDNLKVRRREEFMTGYNIIKLKLKEMYQMITLGGDADFELVDTYDPFTEGIQFNVRPPKKSWKKISNLSGGEKTLSSLALVFALHYYKPSPLYVMDEIDAALDFKNVSIVGNYIKERTKNAQFIIISLRSNMFELCDNLIGIYKTYDCTKSITIDPRVHDKPIDAEEQAVTELTPMESVSESVANMPPEVVNNNQSLMET